jgi:hypothetical protein
MTDYQSLTLVDLYNLAKEREGLDKFKHEGDKILSKARKPQLIRMLQQWDTEFNVPKVPHEEPMINPTPKKNSVPKVPKVPHEEPDTIINAEREACLIIATAEKKASLIIADTTNRCLVIIKDATDKGLSIIDNAQQGALTLVSRSIKVPQPTQPPKVTTSVDPMTLQHVDPAKKPYRLQVRWFHLRYGFTINPQEFLNFIQGNKKRAIETYSILSVPHMTDVVLEVPKNRRIDTMSPHYFDFNTKSPVITEIHNEKLYHEIYNYHKSQGTPFTNLK